MILEIQNLKHEISTDTTKEYQQACQNYKRVNIEFKKQSREINELEKGIEKMQEDLRHKRRKFAAIQESKDSCQSNVTRLKSKLKSQHQMISCKSEFSQSILGEYIYI